MTWDIQNIGHRIMAQQEISIFTDRQNAGLALIAYFQSKIIRQCRDRDEHAVETKMHVQGKNARFTPQACLLHPQPSQQVGQLKVVYHFVSGTYAATFSNLNSGRLSPLTIQDLMSTLPTVAGCHQTGGICMDNEGVSKNYGLLIEADGSQQ